MHDIIPNYYLKINNIIFTLYYRFLIDRILIIIQIPNRFLSYKHIKQL